VKAEVYTYLHAFSAAFEQAWEAAQKLQPHLGLYRSELKRTYFRIEEARLQTLAEWGFWVEGMERTHHARLIERKTQWEAEEQARIHRRDEAEKARWAWERRKKKQEGSDS
jgi:hypothetical protein